MAGSINRLFGFLLVAIALIHNPSAQTTHVVGGPAGWSVPSPATLYSDWATTRTFRVGDSLTIQMTGPVTIRLTSPGTQYYFCTFQGHCSLGQKLFINVVAAAAASPPPTTASPPPPPRTATPPPRSVPPPTSTAVSPPPRSAIPPTPSGVPPPTPTMATPPSTSVVPPTTDTVAPPPVPNSAPELAVASFSATFLFVAAAALLR
ncbi:hypothetical protein ACHQM5_005769 [Ranunculus cassubicifolius]